MTIGCGRRTFGSRRRWASVALVVAAALMGVLAIPWGRSSRADQGYRLTTKQVVVDRAAHWRAWTLGEGGPRLGDLQGVVVIGEEGAIRPRFFTKHIDPITNAAAFDRPIHKNDRSRLSNAYSPDKKKWFARGGISGAGSNVVDAPLAIDRESDRYQTYWEPDIVDAPSNQWWIEVDLGRAVSATSLTVQFVEEGLGDPFLQFRVLVSDGEYIENAKTKERSTQFWVVGGTTRSNIDQRTFTFELEPTAKPSEEWRGAAIQFVRIVMTDTRGDRAEEISEQEYTDLPLNERGRVEYFVRSVSGEETIATQEEYEGVSPERRGRVRYYRWEHPRLADIFIEAVGDNLALGAKERGGTISVTGIGTFPDKAFDGDLTTLWSAQCLQEFGVWSFRGGLMTMDLGLPLWVDTFRFITQGTLWGYMLRVSAGERAPDGSIQWTEVSPAARHSNSAYYRRIEDQISPRKIRYIEFRNIDVTGWGSGRYWYITYVREIQLFGEGYVPDLTLVSDLIELGGQRNLSTIEWDADAPPGAGVEIHTRTGNELRLVKHFYDRQGKEVSRDYYYTKLASFQRGDSTEVRLPGADWSGWSEPYREPGDRVRSPSPRQYLMLMVRLTSDDPYAFATVRSIRLNFRPPWAKSVRGEVWNSAETPTTGADTELDLFLRPLFIESPAPPSEGFDDVLLQAPGGVDMELLQVGLGSQEAFENGDVDPFVSDGDGAWVNGAGERIQLVRQTADSLWIRLPEVIGPQPADPRRYYRKARGGDETSVDGEGRSLSKDQFENFAPALQGHVEYYRVVGYRADGSPILAQVTRAAYDTLTAEERDVAYFRKLSEGEEIPVDKENRPLTRTSYNRLSAAERGSILVVGDLIHLRLRANLYQNSIRFPVSVTNSRSELSMAWQRVESGDVTGLTPAQSMDLFTPIRAQVLKDITLDPKAFTPNGDGVNDVLEIGFSVLKIDATRPIAVRMLDLSGRLLKEMQLYGASGRYTVSWDGRDNHGDPVPPGVYLCEIRADVDSESGSTRALHTVTVVY